MLYKEFKGLKLSALGLGTMRLPTKLGNDSEIDYEKSEEMFDIAIKSGINYFDTAWGYHGGMSEIATGNLLKKYPRESFYLATKFPGFNTENMEKKEEIFNKQLEKCQVDYFDFYLFHCLSEKSFDYYTSKEYDLMNYLLKLKKEGKIRHIGFSTHASFETTKKFIDTYREHIEFCQIQLNYLDWTLLEANKFVELLKEYNIPIWVMEPVRGGMLAKISDEYAEKLKVLRPDESVPSWAFRFLQTIPEVTMILSGMSTKDQLLQNIATFSEDKPLNEEELKTILDVADDMLKRKRLPCTGCKYCITKCPANLDIPKIIEVYNDCCFTGNDVLPRYVVADFNKGNSPKECIGCKSCEQVCPQNIKISEAMSDMSNKF